MSRYTGFGESLAMGKARAEEEQALRDEEEYALPQMMGEIVRRMGDYFGCPAEQVGYVDPLARVSTRMREASAPPLYHNPETGLHGFDVEIVLRHPDGEEYPVWLHLECASLRHGGVEIHFGPDHFQLPTEEEAFFDHVADAIDQSLRESYVPAPRKLGYEGIRPAGNGLAAT